MDDVEASVDEVQTRLLGFGPALNFVKNGKKVARSGWNGKGMYIALQTPTELSKMTLPYIYMYTADEHLVPWLASQTDLLSNYWQIVA